MNFSMITTKIQENTKRLTDIFTHKYSVKIRNRLVDWAWLFNYIVFFMMATILKTMLETHPEDSMLFREILQDFPEGRLCFSMKSVKNSIFERMRSHMYLISR